MDTELIKDNIFQQRDDLYNQPIKTIPKPGKEIGIDLNDTIITNIIDSVEGTSTQFDVNALNTFTSVSMNRNELYQTLDYMAEDSIMGAVLETYAEDATETNDNGDIVWVEAEDAEISKYITYLLSSLGVNKNIYNWTHSLCKYGDLYLRLYRESEYEDRLFKKPKEEPPEIDLEESTYRPNQLNEDVKINVFSKHDKYIHYVEMVENPAQVFELTRFGKTAAYIQTEVEATNTTGTMDSLTATPSLFRYKFNTNDINLYQPTEFVHASLQDNTSRCPEEVELFIDTENEEQTSLKYKVKCGQSLLQNTYKVWRQLQLLENSVLLNRITQSSIVRVIGVEVGDMPKESVQPHLAGIKQMIEQKSAINAGVSFNEYTNPGPIINNIYVPTREGKGNITTSQIGGDVDVKGLADLDYYQDKVFGSLRVPKQYFGVTDDNAGFSGGQSLSIISSRYAKMIKRIQNTMCQAITDIINLILLDSNNPSYINNFTIKMLPPTTQEEVDRRDNISNKVGLVQDIMGNLADIENPITKLKILKSLLGNTINNPEVIQFIQEEIEALEAQAEEEVAPTEEGGGDDSFGEDDGLGDLFGGGTSEGGGSDLGLGDLDIGTDLDTEEISTDTATEETSDSLPSPADLDIGDLSDSTNPALV